MREAIKNGKIEGNLTLRVIYFLLGLGFLSLGVMGFIFPFIPGMFLIFISAYFFARSSTRFLRFIMHNRFFGKHVHSFVHAPETPVHAIILIIVSLLISAAFGCYYYYTR